MRILRIDDSTGDISRELSPQETLPLEEQEEHLEKETELRKETLDDTDQVIYLGDDGDREVFTERMNIPPWSRM